MYAHKVANYPKTNITRRVMMEQETIPSPSWLSKLKEESLTIGITLKLDELEKLNKTMWSATVTEAVQRAEEEDLELWKKTSKKYGSMNGGIKLKEYCIKLNSEDSMNILKLRLGMTPAKANYRNMHKDTICPKCLEEEETSEHLISCNMEKTINNTNCMSNFKNNIENAEITEIAKLKNLSMLLSKSILSRASALDASHPPTNDAATPSDEGGDLDEDMDTK